jgi:hypothetical protein
LTDLAYRRRPNSEKTEERIVEDKAAGRELSEPDRDEFPAMRDDREEKKADGADKA